MVLSRTLLFTLILAGNVGATGAALADESDGAQAVYERACAACHSGGFGGFFTGAPKTGKKSDWEPLLVKGVDGLVASTLKGVGKMEARGGCADCSDADIRAAVEYMVAKSR